MGYVSSANLEFVGVAKRSRSQEYAEVTIAFEPTKRYLMETPLLILEIQLEILPPPLEGFSNPNAPEVLKNPILVKGLPLDKSQLHISFGLHKLLGPKNVLAITYNKVENDFLGFMIVLPLYVV